MGHDLADARAKEQEAGIACIGEDWGRSLFCLENEHVWPDVAGLVCCFCWLGLLKAYLRFLIYSFQRLWGVMNDHHQEVSTCVFSRRVILAGSILSFPSHFDPLENS